MLFWLVLFNTASDINIEVSGGCYRQREECYGPFGFNKLRVYMYPSKIMWHTSLIIIQSLRWSIDTRPTPSRNSLILCSHSLSLVASSDASVQEGSLNE